MVYPRLFFSFCIGYNYSEELIFVFALPIKTTSVGAEFLCTQMTEALSNLFESSVFIFIVRQRSIFYLPNLVLFDS